MIYFFMLLPYLGLPEVAIIVVTIFINILGISYWNRIAEDVTGKSKSYDLVSYLKNNNR